MLPYRQNVSIIARRGDEYLLVNLTVWDEDCWKFPQGGIEDGETPEETAVREFGEELGTEKIRILGMSTITNRYDWPAETVKVHNHRFRGQEQRFVFAEYEDENEPVPDPSEVRAYRWARRDEILTLGDQGDHRYFRDYNGNIPKLLGEFDRL